MKQLLFNARAEILDLRKQVEILRAQVKVMDLLAALLNSDPPKREADRHTDVVWDIELALREMEGKKSDA